MSPEVSRVLEAARRAMGAGPDLPGVFADASVRGPGYTFRTAVHSGADGTLRMEQTTGFLAVLHGGRSWGERGEEWMAPLDAFNEAFARGHELHALVLWPETRLTDPEYLGVVPIPGGEAIAIRWRVNEMGTKTLHYSVADTLPLGMRTEWVDPPVDVRFADWRPLAGGSAPGLRLFRQAIFDQAGEIFEYTYDRVEVGSVPDSLLVPPRRGVAGQPD